MSFSGAGHTYGQNQYEQRRYRADRPTYSQSSSGAQVKNPSIDYIYSSLRQWSNPPSEYGDFPTSYSIAPFGANSSTNSLVRSVHMSSTPPIPTAWSVAGIAAAAIGQAAALGESPPIRESSMLPRKTSSLFKEFSSSAASGDERSKSLEAVSFSHSEPRSARQRGSFCGVAKTALATPVRCVPARGGVSVVHVRAMAAGAR
jgi:hypothetical protein